MILFRREGPFHLGSRNLRFEHPYRATLEPGIWRRCPLDRFGSRNVALLRRCRDGRADSGRGVRLGAFDRRGAGGFLAIYAPWARDPGRVLGVDVYRGFAKLCDLAEV